ncbi:ribosome assembly factor SBDS [Candidatus Woesearchaeota archaeon]|nr:ribosome assembly factor SBDS [Candidatus Woesearchaeota archaeon]
MNLARLKKGGEKFEVAIDSEKAMAFRNGGISDVRDVLEAEHIFSDAKKGSLASEHELQRMFKTTDPLAIAAIIIKEGEIQLTEAYRERKVEEKQRRLIALIHRNGVDPKTHLPHPMSRIEHALAEAKAHIDPFLSAEEQMGKIVKQIQPVLPIRFELKEVTIKIPPEYAAKAYGSIKGFGRMLKEEWLNDGSWLGIIEIPGGMEEELYDQLNKATHGNNQTSVKVK